MDEYGRISPWILFGLASNHKINREANSGTYDPILHKFFVCYCSYMTGKTTVSTSSPGVKS
jgi:hypothetical protein